MSLHLTKFCAGTLNLRRARLIKAMTLKLSLCIEIAREVFDQPFKVDLD